MKNKNWIYGLIVFLAQTCNPHYSKIDLNNNGNHFEEIESVEKLTLEEEEDLRIAADEIVSLDTIDEVREVKEEVIEYGPIFKVVEDLFVPLDCELEKTNESKKICAQEKFQEYIYQNLVYPEMAKKNGVEGEVIIQFLIGKEGIVSKPKIIQDIGRRMR